MADRPAAIRPSRHGRLALAATSLLAALAALSLPTLSAANSGKEHPTVSTGGVGHVRGTSVVLNGSVDPHGLTTTYYFVYGPTESYGYQTPPQTLEAKDEQVKVSVAIADFPVGYHYRLVASNTDGSRLGRDKRYGKSAKLTFKLPRSLTPVPYRHGFTLSGNLVGQDDEHVTVALQETPYPFLEAFGDVGASQQTGAGGSFTFNVPALYKTGKFRVVTKQPRPVYSGVVTEQVTPEITLRVQKSSVKGLVRLFGTISPSENGARVLLQMSVAVRPGDSQKSSERTSRFTTQFSTVARRGTRSLSRFGLIVKISQSGQYRAYVSLRKGPLGSAASNTVSLTAGTGRHKKHGG